MNNFLTASSLDDCLLLEQTQPRASLMRRADQGFDSQQDGLRNAPEPDFAINTGNGYTALNALTTTWSQKPVGRFVTHVRNSQRSRKSEYL